MQASQPATWNWWTQATLRNPDGLRACRSRVRHWLEWYPELREACYGQCAVEARELPEAPVGRGGGRGDGWVELLLIKADIDRAISTACTPRQQQAVRLCWLSGATQRDVAKRMGVRPTAVSRLLGRAVDNITAWLGGPRGAGK